MNSGFSRPWLPFALVAVLGAYLWFHFQYPFWFMWDMDHTTLVDTVLMQSGKWPVHLNHPGFGMYLPLKWSHLVAHWLGFVSILNLEDLKESLGPILGVAELSAFLRLHSPFVVAGIVLLQWRALTLIFPLGNLASFVLFALLATQPALFYHSTMIRTELYAVFWWSAAIWAFAKAALEPNARREALITGLGGFFLGLCLLTKIQAIVYLAGGVVLLEMFRVHAGKARKGNGWLEPRLRWLSIGVFVLALFFLIGAAFRRPYGATFTEEYPINVIGVSFGLAALLCLLNGLGKLPAKVSSLAGYFIQRGTAVVAGFLAAFLTHFFVYSDPGNSYRYMLLDAKMIFYRRNVDAQLLHFGDHSRKIYELISYNPALYFACGALFTLTFPYRTRLALPRKFLGAAFFLAFLSAFYLSRALLRDLLWVESLVMVLTLWLALELHAQATRAGKVVVPALLALVLGGGAYAISRIRGDLDANYSNYGWNSHRLFDGTYFDGHIQFAPALHARYPKEGSKERADAFLHAMNYARAKRTAQFVLSNAKLNIKNVGLCAPGQVPMRAEPDLRFAEVPEALLGGTVVDAAGVELDPRGILDNKLVDGGSETLGKRKPESFLEQYSVLGRSDLDVFLVTDLSQLSLPKEWGAVGEVHLEGEGSKAELRAYKVKTYSVLSRIKLGKRHFFVVREELSK